MADETDDTTETPEPSTTETAPEDTLVAGEEPGYQLVDEGEHHYEVKHPDGSTFKVAKAGIDGLTQKKIAGLPPAEKEITPPTNAPTASGLENGFSPEDLANIDGMAQKRISDFTPDVYDPVTGKTSKGQPNPFVVQNIKENALRQYMAAKQTLASGTAASPFEMERAKGIIEDAKGNLQPTPEQTPPLVQTSGQPGQPGQATNAAYNPQGATPAAFAPVSDVNPSVPQGTEQGAPQPQSPFGAMLQGIEQEKGAAQENMASQMNLAKQQAQAYQDQQQKLQTIQADFDKKREQNYQRMDSVRQQVLDGKIDPGHFWASKSVPNQIGSAIAIFLGGLGGGISGHGGNAAMDIINKAIDRDIEGQKANLGQKNNALRMLMEEGHDLNTAENIQRGNQIAATGAQVQKYIAQAQAPQAKLQGTMLLNQLNQQAMSVAMQGAQFQMAAGLGAGKAMNINPEFVQDPKLKERLVRLPNGMYAAANRKEDVEPVNKMLEQINPIYSDLDQLDKIGQSAFGGVLSLEARESAEKIRGRLAISLNKAEGMQRYNPALADELKKSLRDASWKQFLAGAPKGKEMKDYLMNQTNSMLGQRLMNFNRPPEIKSARPARGE